MGSQSQEHRVYTRTRTHAHACARVGAALDADLDTAVGAFNGSTEDRRTWASIAWRVGVEEFHFALMDKLAEDAVDGTRHVRSRAADANGRDARCPSGRRCGMTFRMALKLIQRTAPETESTFRTICRNRYCRPVRDWAIFDLARSKKLPYDSVKRRYNRHLARLHEIFRVPVGG